VARVSQAAFALNFPDGRRPSGPSGTFVSGPGCYAYQVDGVGFSKVIVFKVAA